MPLLLNFDQRFGLGDDKTKPDSNSSYNFDVRKPCNDSIQIRVWLV